MIAWAQASGHKEVVALLQANLEEEKKADMLLSHMATLEINPEAAKAA